jgi:subtilisin family serine protease
MMIQSRRSALALTVCAGALALAGCGGGGSSGGPGVQPTPIAPPLPPAPPPPPPPPPPGPATAASTINYNDIEYRRSNGATSSGAINAWQAGATGRGIKVAVIDSGINPALPEFAGRIDPASADVNAGTNRGVADTEGHGTAVAATIAAARNGAGAMGVAFDSTIISFNSSNPDNCDKDDGCKHTDSAIGRGIDLARLNGARVINVSLGGDGVGGAVLNAVSRAAQAGIVVVISAGNDSKVDPSPFALTTANRAGAGHVIIAGSVGTAIGGDPANGTDLGAISTFSNQAGAGAAHYLTALGYRVRTIDQTGTGYLYSGTSFAAPVISGAAALLAQAFPNLTGRQIVDILLSTGDDIGESGRDAVFGNGRLNIARAMAPQGATTAAGTGVPVSTGSNGQSSGASGDALVREPIGAVILDGYSRAYAIDLARTLSVAAQQAPLGEALQGDLRTGWARAGTTAVAVTVRRNLTGQPQVGLAQAGMSFEDSRAARAIAGMALSRITPDTAVAFGFSESGRTLQQRLAGTGGLPFLVARDPLTRAGFHADSGASAAVRHDLGPVAVTLSAESGDVWLDRDPRALPGAALPVRPGYSVNSVTLDRRLGDFSLSLGGSRLAEESTTLGGRFSFAPGATTTYFADATATWENGSGWGAQASYRRGWSLLPGGNGLARGGTMRSDAFALDAWRDGALKRGDRLALRVMQPLRTSGGGHVLNLPVSYDYATLSAGYELRRLNLTPSGRELDLEAAYGLPILGGAGWLSANAFLRHQPGHVAAMESDRGAAIRLNLGW